MMKPLLRYHHSKRALPLATEVDIFFLAPVFVMLLLCYWFIGLSLSLKSIRAKEIMGLAQNSIYSIDIKA